MIADEKEETHQNQVLQENQRDYKSIDDTSTENSIENQTEAVDQFIEPARLVSPVSNDNFSPSYMLTTAPSSRVGYYDPPVTTARIGLAFKTTQSFNNSYPIKRFYPSSTMPNSWRIRSYSDMQQSPSFHSTDYNSSPGPTSMIVLRDKWKNKSGCYYSCIQQAKGLQTVVSKYDFSTNIQLCEPTKIVS